MSGLTPLPLTHFRKALRGRGVTFESLADEIGLSRTHVSEVLHGRRDGAEVYPRIQAVVTAEEWAHLLRMEHCATWNTAARAQGSTARVWAMRQQCAECKRWEGFVSCVEAVAGSVTHSICPDCYPKFKAQIDALCDGIAAQPEPAASIGEHPFLSRFNHESSDQLTEARRAG